MKNDGDCLGTMTTDELESSFGGDLHKKCYDYAVEAFRTCENPFHCPCIRSGILFDLLCEDERADR